MSKDLTNQQLAMRVSINCIFGNVILSGLKLVAGILGKSGAMISDSVHSMSDVFSTFVVMAGIKLSGKASDDEHQYGHERLECVAALILSIILCVTGVGIGISGLKVIFGGGDGIIEIPTLLPLVAAVLSIVIKEAMYWYTRAAAKKINSGALMADAWHHRSDALSSVGSFVGILGARMGFPLLDPIASVVICLFIVKASFDIFKDAINKMVDKACDEKTVGEMKEVIEKQQGVIGIKQLKTRLFGDKIYVDVEIFADKSITLEQAHCIAHVTHDAIEGNFNRVKHCMVHVDPAEPVKE